MTDQLWEQKWDDFSKKEIREEIEREKHRKEHLQELSPALLKRARDKFEDRYYPTKNNHYDWSRYTNLEKDKDGNPLHPKDKKPLDTHLRNFSDAIAKAYRDLPPADETLIAKAQELYDTADIDWKDEEMFDNYEHGYGEFGDVGEIEDENGDTWTFYRSYQGHDEGGSIEVDEIEEVEFEAPDGRSGYIPRP